MTSFAFILGVVPLVVSEGAGAEMRRTLGTAVFGGMLGVTLFGIFLTPVFYYVIQWFNDLWQRRKARPPRRGLPQWMRSWPRLRAPRAPVAALSGRNGGGNGAAPRLHKPHDCHPGPPAGPGG